MAITYFRTNTVLKEQLESNNLYTERELMQQVAQGNEQAFKTLYRRFGPLLLPFLMKLTGSQDLTDEIIQEVFLRIWVNRDKLIEVEYPRAYIFRMASNRVHDWINKNILAQNAANKHLEGMPVTENTIESNLQIREILHVVQQAVEELPAQRRKIYILNREKGMTATEIAEHLGLSIPTVKNTLTSALKHIRERLVEKGYLAMLLLLLKK